MYNQTGGVPILQNSAGSFAIDANGARTPLTSQPVQRIPTNQQQDVCCPRCSYKWTSYDQVQQMNQLLAQQGQQGQGQMMYDPVELNKLAQARRNQAYGQNNPLYAVNDVPQNGQYVQSQQQQYAPAPQNQYYQQPIQQQPAPCNQPQGYGQQPQQHFASNNPVVQLLAQELQRAQQSQQQYY